MGTSTAPQRSASGSTRPFQIGLLTLAGVLILFGAMFGAQTMFRLRGSIDWVTHTLGVKTVIEQLKGDSHDVDAYGLRYLLSQQEEHEQAHDRAILAVNSKIADLRVLLADNQEQMRRLDEIQRLHQQRNAWFERSMGRTQDLGVDEASSRVRRGGDGQLAQSIRLELDRMEMIEQGLLQERQNNLNDALTQGSVTVILLNCLALIMAVVALVLLRRGARDQQARREVEVRAVEAERLSREKSEFLASMSHEIRTPMNAVLGFSQLLSRTRIEPKAREYLKAIRTSGEALLALINDILDLSKIEAKKLSLSPQPLEVRELVDSTAGVFSEAANSKGLTLRTRVPPDVPHSMTIDPHRFRQALMNLLSNAIKYTDEGEVLLEVVAISKSKRTADLEFRVRDTGRGIDPDQLNKLFEPFHRAVSEEDAESGTGLGLAIVRRLMDLMGGQVRVDSAKGKGSTFTLVLHGVRTDQMPSNSAPDLGDGDSFSKLASSRIMIVDDVQWNRDLLQAFLVEGTHELAFARNGQEAVDVALSFHPDIVLMDLRMPVLDGREATRRIRQQLGENAPVIIAVSASSMSREEREIEEYFDGYIRKPVVREVLFQALAEHVGSSNLVLPEYADSEAEGRDLDEAKASAFSEAAVIELRRLLRDVVPRLKGSLRANEVRAFAEELVALGKDEQQTPLIYFGERLRAAVERFDVNLMESLIEQADEHLEAVLHTRG